MTRAVTKQAWPENGRHSRWIEATKSSRSASSRSTAADLPPISAMTGLRVRAHSTAIVVPATVDPVKEILSTPGWETTDMPVVGVHTVRGAHAVHLAGIALEAGASLILDKAAMAAEADRLGLFVVGVQP